MFFKKKTVIATSIIFVLIIFVAVIFIVKNNYGGRLDSIISIYDETKDRSGIYVNREFVGFVDGKAELENNMDNSIIVIVAKEKVYVMTDKKIKKIADDMTLVGIANFSEEILLKDGKGVLYIYKDSEIKKITDKKTNVAVISGDGTAYAYSNDEEAVYFDGKETKFENVVISHISTDGELVYATKNVSDKEFELLVVDGEKLKSVESKVTNIIGLNSDGTELMYTTAEGTFVYANGKDKFQVTEDIVYDVYYYDDENLWCGDFWSFDTLKGSVCMIVKDDDLSNSQICKLTDEYRAEVIVEQCYEFVGINKKMSKIFYKGKNNNLYRIDADLGAEGELLAESVDLVRISTDGSKVYFTRQDSKQSVFVYCVENGLKEKQLAYVFDFFDIIVFDKYSYLEAKDIYLIKNDTVNKCDELGDLKCFFIDYLTQSAYGYDENSVYEIKNGKKIKLDGEYEKITAYDYIY